LENLCSHALHNTTFDQTSLIAVTEGMQCSTAMTNPGVAKSTWGVKFGLSVYLGWGMTSCYGQCLVLRRSNKRTVKNE